MTHVFTDTPRMPAQVIPHENITQVQRLPIRQIVPDPAQPRRILPGNLYAGLHARHLTPVQALQEFIRHVQLIARRRGRPFSSISELLQIEDETPNHTPQETLLRDLVTLAFTIRDEGQINPITVARMTRHYRIETGERRYWASWLMMKFLQGYQGDETMPCIIIPGEQTSALRQARENTTRADLNAIALARQAALLILAAHSIHPPVTGPLSNDFYRQALDLDLRGRRDCTTDILTAMGGIQKAHFSRLKALLRLSDEALELADRHNLPEFKLRPILNLPPEQHSEVIRQIITFNLSGKEVQELCQPAPKDDCTIPLPRHAIRFARSVLSDEKSDITTLSAALLNEETDIERVKSRLHDFIEKVIRCLPEA